MKSRKSRKNRKSQRKRKSWKSRKSRKRRKISESWKSRKYMKIRKGRKRRKNQKNRKSWIIRNSRKNSKSRKNRKSRKSKKCRKRSKQLQIAPNSSNGSILQDWYHALLKGELEVLALGVFLQISLNLYVCHITHLIVGSLNFFEIFQFTTFSIDINVPPLCTQKVSFSALVQQETFKSIDIGI